MITLENGDELIVSHPTTDELVRATWKRVVKQSKVEGRSTYEIDINGESFVVYTPTVKYHRSKNGRWGRLISIIAEFDKYNVATEYYNDLTRHGLGDEMYYWPW